MALSSGFRLGFQAPYAQEEATWLCLRLAQLAESRGLAWSWFPSHKPVEAVHPAWDARIFAAPRCSFPAWLDRVSHVLWCDVQLEKLAYAKSRGKHNTLLALWHQLKEVDFDAFSLFDRIVCPHAGVQALLAERGDWETDCCPWDAGLPARPSRPLVTDDRVRCYFPLDTYDARHHAAVFFHAWEWLLDDYPEVRLTVSAWRHWSRGAWEALWLLRKRHPTRVLVLKKPDLLTHWSQYDQHDWVFRPSLRVNTPHGAQEACSQRLPILVYDVPPATESVKHRENGWRIPCDVEKGRWGVPTGRPRVGPTHEALTQVAGNPKLLSSLQRYWPEDIELRGRFEEFWLAQWCAAAAVK